MKSFITVLLISLTPLYSAAQYISSVTTPDKTIPVINDTSDIAVVIANTILGKDLKSHLSILASDEYEGRETGEKGNDLAASYIANEFKQMGLPAIGIENSYFQNVAFNKTQWEKNALTVNDKEYKHLWDYLSFANQNEHLPYYTPKEVIFLGYGIDDDISRITGTAERSNWSTDVYKKLYAAKAAGVKFVFLISNDIQKFLGENRKYLVSPSLELGDGEHKSDFANHAYISSTIAKEIIGKKAKKIKRWRKKNIKRGKACDIKLKPEIEFTMAKKVQVIAGRNVAGYIEGTDKKEELIVVSGHYDHLGIRGSDIYNGADDNGSGTSTVMEIAEALSEAKKMGKGPRRSVLCLLVTGEEKGLLGSRFYSESPMFPLENTVANVNIDMVGRVDKKYQNNPDYIYVIGSDRLSTDLHNISEQVNQKYTQPL